MSLRGALAKIRAHALWIFYEMLMRTDALEFWYDLTFGLERRQDFGSRAYWAFHRFVIPSRGDVGLVFFCGLGDALYGLSVLGVMSQQLKSQGRRFLAYAVDAQDQFSNRDLHQFLTQTGLFDEVHRITGSPTQYWKYYDWSSLALTAPASLTLFPFIYKTRRSVSHRIDSIYAQFSLARGPRSIPLSVPPSPRALQLAEELVNIDRLVFLHCDTRSGSYLYPHRKLLVEHLNDLGWYVASFTDVEKVSARRYCHIAPATLTLPDTAYLLKQLGAPVIALNSVLWPLGMAAGSRLLALHYLRSPDGHHFHYDQMQFVSSVKYCVDRIPSAILARSGTDYVENARHHLMIDYRPEAIVRWFGQSFA